MTRAPLQLRREASSEFIQYPVAPLIVRLADLAGYGANVRAKIFDFGVVSLRISVPYAGDWTGFAALGRRLRRDAAFEALARATLDALLAEMAAALVEPHGVLVEDYFVFDVDQFAHAIEAKKLTRDLAAELGQLLLFEDHALDTGQQDEALRVALSYYPDDLVVVQWDAAFVYDRPGSAEAVVDILELTDRTANALKVIGDAYYARLYRAAAGRLGLADWQGQIDAKLRSVSEIYRVLQDQAQYARSEFLEIVIIVLIALEAIIALRH